MDRRVRGLLVAAFLAVLLVFNAFPVSGAPDIDVIIFVDYYRPTHTGPTAPDPAPCRDSESFKTIRGVKWTEFPVTYKIDPSGSGDVDGDGSPGTANDLNLARQAVVNAFNTWDAEEHGGVDTNGDGVKEFFKEAAAGETAKISVLWAFIDGVGGALASTSITYNVATKAIVSVKITFDSGDAWRVLGTLTCSKQDVPGVLAFDIEDVAAHEIGHAIGLDHTQRLGDTYLTMYPYVLFEGETHKRTLGTGDRLGLAKLYP